jgi:hypothetical protein
LTLIIIFASQCQVFGQLCELCLRLSFNLFPLPMFSPLTRIWPKHSQSRKINHPTRTHLKIMQNVKILKIKINEIVKHYIVKGFDFLVTKFSKLQIFGYFDQNIVPVYYIKNWWRIEGMHVWVIWKNNCPINNWNEWIMDDKIDHPK